MTDEANAGLITLIRSRTVQQADALQLVGGRIVHQRAASVARMPIPAAIPHFLGASTLLAWAQVRRKNLAKQFCEAFC
jgi:hypothetical protein